MNRRYVAQIVHFAMAIALACCPPVDAVGQVLRLSVIDTLDRPVEGVTFGIAGGSVSAATTQAGETEMALDPKAEPGDWVSLNVIPTASTEIDWAFIEPWDKQVRVPPFEAKANFVRIVLAERGARQRLETNPGKVTTLTVARSGEANFRSISAAVAAANAGDIIRVQPGHYRESIRIDKEVHVTGTGHEVGDVVVEARDGPCIIFEAPQGAVQNMTLRYTGSGKEHCVNINQGRLLLADNDIMSKGMSGVAVRDDAAPVIIGNRVHDSEQAGILMMGGARGRVEDNDITDNRQAGIAVVKGSDPLVVGNRIERNRSIGIVITLDSTGIFEGNRIVENAEYGIHVTRGAEPRARANEISNNGRVGVVVALRGSGHFLDNTIMKNVEAGVLIQKGGDPTFIRNRISDNSGDGILIQDHGRGTFEKNEISGNRYAAWNVDKSSDVVRCGE